MLAVIGVVVITGDVGVLSCFSVSFRVHSKEAFVATEPSSGILYHF